MAFDQSSVVGLIPTDPVLFPLADPIASENNGPLFNTTIRASSAGASGAASGTPWIELDPNNFTIRFNPPLDFGNGCLDLPVVGYVNNAEVCVDGTRLFARSAYASGGTYSELAWDALDAAMYATGTITQQGNLPDADGGGTDLLRFTSLAPFGAASTLPRILIGGGTGPTDLDALKIFGAENGGLLIAGDHWFDAYVTIQHGLSGDGIPSTISMQAQDYIDINVDGPSTSAGFVVETDAVYLRTSSIIFLEGFQFFLDPFFGPRTPLNNPFTSSSAPQAPGGGQTPGGGGFP